MNEYFVRMSSSSLRQRLSQFKEECKADVAEIENALRSSTCSLTVGDDAFVEDCRNPGSSKKFRFDGKSWIFVSRVNTSIVTDKIEQKNSCIQASIDMLRRRDIPGSILALQSMIDSEDSEIVDSPISQASKTSSIYTAFVSRTLREVASTRSDISPKDRMRLAMIMWKEFKLSIT